MHTANTEWENEGNMENGVPENDMVKEEENGVLMRGTGSVVFYRLLFAPG